MIYCNSYYNKTFQRWQYICWYDIHEHEIFLGDKWSTIGSVPNFKQNFVKRTPKLLTFCQNVSLKWINLNSAGWCPECSEWCPDQAWDEKIYSFLTNFMRGIYKAQSTWTLRFLYKSVVQFLEFTWFVIVVKKAC